MIKYLDLISLPRLVFHITVTFVHISRRLFGDPVIARCADHSINDKNWYHALIPEYAAYSDHADHEDYRV